jgi:Flp pilus assembly protein TadD
LTLLARIRLIQKRYEEAAQTALEAVGKQHFTPLAHLYLGSALTRLGDLKRARLALETAAALAPKMRAAHRLLAWLHMQPGGDPSKALHHQRMLHR